MKKRILILVLALAILLTATAVPALADLRCANCGGDGLVSCGFCGGLGYIRRGVQRTGFVMSPCGVCHQTGKVSCSTCGGDGRIGSSIPAPSDGGGGGGGSTTHKANLDKTELTLIAGRSETLKVLWGSGTVKWSSSNKRVATVSSKGVVKAKKAGKCTVTAAVGSQKLKCKVKVTKQVYAKSIKLSQKSATILVDGQLDLDYIVSPDTTKITEPWSVTVSSNKQGVASVDDEGKVVGHKPGKATVTAKLKIRKGKTVSAKCKIAVEKGLTRFKRWFDKHSSKSKGKRVLYTGENDTITYDPSAGTWTFYRIEDGSMGYSEHGITFNGDFTGTAYMTFYYRSKIGGWETEATASASVNSLSQYATYDWSFTKGSGYSERNLANTHINALLSAMQVPLVNDARLNAKGGWRDLGLKGY